MKVFSNYETEILRKYKSASIISEKDEMVLNRYGSIGFVAFGFNWDIMQETAKLTELGIKHL